MGESRRLLIQCKLENRRIIVQRECSQEQVLEIFFKYFAGSDSMTLFWCLIMSKSSDVDTLVLHLVTVVHVVDGALLPPSRFRIIKFERSTLSSMKWQVLE